MDPWHAAACLGCDAAAWRPPDGRAAAKQGGQPPAPAGHALECAAAHALARAGTRRTRCRDLPRRARWRLRPRAPRTGSGHSIAIVTLPPPEGGVGGWSARVRRAMPTRATLIVRSHSTALCDGLRFHPPKHGSPRPAAARGDWVPAAPETVLLMVALWQMLLTGARHIWQMRC